MGNTKSQYESLQVKRINLSEERRKAWDAKIVKE